MVLKQSRYLSSIKTRERNWFKMVSPCSFKWSKENFMYSHLRVQFNMYLYYTHTIFILMLELLLIVGASEVRFSRREPCLLALCCGSAIHIYEWRVCRSKVTENAFSLSLSLSPLYCDFCCNWTFTVPMRFHV